MDRNEASSVIRRYLTCTDITHSCNGKCEKCRYHTSDEEKELALKLAIAALECKDTNVPAKSALDHIHNVVRDDAYKRGYEQGKADAKAKAIPVGWIKKHAAKLNRIGYWSDVRAINVMLIEWKDEQGNASRRG
jgi:hypothetical protein